MPRPACSVGVAGVDAVAGGVGTVAAAGTDSSRPLHVGQSHFKHVLHTL